MKPSAYYDPNAITREVEQGRHRAAIGGLWDEMGQLQLDFLKSEGLTPEHKVLDIGCGALRFGHLAVDYLDAGNYYGQDLAQELIQAGYEQELSDELRLKLPQSNLAANAEFDFSHLNAPMDCAIAQSVFTHLPLNHIRQCLIQLESHMVAGGVFYATFFLCPEGHALTQAYSQNGAIEGEPVITTSLSDPYHYRISDFEYAISGLSWRLEGAGEWNHPRGQQMLKFVKQ
ncbi:MAG: class I SAM-dependent methyltransferase [Rickettsiales bacterium]|nr:class I SAM-dependent methyltransferase [Rickettsiales bacterium]